MSEQDNYLPGNYYSPIPDFEDIKKNRAKYFDRTIKNLLGILNNEDKQLELLSNLKQYMNDLIWNNSDIETRASFNNGWFDGYDAIVLTSILRYFKPKNIIEIGSGHSTAFTMDTKDYYLQDLNITCIEPNPERLLSVLKENDNINIIAQNVQDIDKSIFQKLESGDILFIDSSHVSKIGSDVNYLLFEILPILKQGVIIHFHDVPHPFEYHESFYLKFERAWNECYLLRAFLQYNESFQILLQVTFLRQFHPELFDKNIISGSSIWIRKEK